MFKGKRIERLYIHATSIPTSTDLVRRSLIALPGFLMQEIVTLQRVSCNKLLREVSQQILSKVRK